MYQYQGQCLVRFFVVSADEIHIYNLCLKDCHNYQAHSETNLTILWKGIDWDI